MSTILSLVAIIIVYWWMPRRVHRRIHEQAEEVFDAGMMAMSNLRFEDAKDLLGKGEWCPVCRAFVTETLAMKGVCEQLLGNWTSAFHHFELAYEIDKKCAPGLQGLISILTSGPVDEIRDLGRAKRLLEEFKAVAAESELAILSYSAAIAAEEGRWEEAVSAYEKVVCLDETPTRKIRAERLKRLRNREKLRLSTEDMQRLYAASVQEND